MKQIPLTQGKFALVDDEYFDELIKYNWHAKAGRNTFYVSRCIYLGVIDGVKRGTTITMHRHLLNAPADTPIDHKDGNGLNCQRSNFRTCTRSQNAANKHGYGSSKYLGVSFEKDRKKWKAAIKISALWKSPKRLGSFLNELDAARAYNEAAKIYHGEFANLNVIPE